jgi:hypothetical protein
MYDHFWGQLTSEECNDPRWSPDNDHAWTAFFERQRDNRDPPVNNNASGQRQWWSALGRTLAWVLGNIAVIALLGESAATPARAAATSRSRRRSPTTRRKNTSPPRSRHIYVF